MRSHLHNSLVKLTESLSRIMNDRAVEFDPHDKLVVFLRLNEISMFQCKPVSLAFHGMAQYTEKTGRPALRWLRQNTPEAAIELYIVSMPYDYDWGVDGDHYLKVTLPRLEDAALFKMFHA